MNKFKKKLGGADKGFTLVEMLIVVAIIAILIAISIPLINSALDKAKHSTDAANERAAKAIIVVASLDGQESIEAKNDGDDPVAFAAGTVYAYNAKDGNLTLKTASAGTYGKHHVDGYIIVSMDTAGNVSTGWIEKGTDIPTSVTSWGDTCSDPADSGHPSFATGS